MTSNPEPDTGRPSDATNPDGAPGPGNGRPVPGNSSSSNSPTPNQPGTSSALPVMPATTVPSSGGQNAAPSQLDLQPRKVSVDVLPQGQGERWRLEIPEASMNGISPEKVVWEIRNPLGNLSRYSGRVVDVEMEFGRHELRLLVGDAESRFELRPGSLIQMER